MRSFLLQPYPFGLNKGRKLRACAAIGLFVALFLALFRPFGIGELPPRQQWQHPFLFGLVTFAVTAAIQLAAPKLAPKVFSETNWKSWKEILFLLLILLAVSAGNFWLMQVLYPAAAPYRSFAPVVWMTVQVGIFPVVAVVFLKQMLLYRRYAAEALQVNREMEPPAGVAPVPEAPAPQTIVLEGEGQKEKLRLQPDQLLFIASADNYVRVVFQENGSVQSRLLRATLKQMEQQLAVAPSLFRCHRMFLVNLDLVAQVTGNAQGLRLHLNGAEEAVPVSRSLTQTLRERLGHLYHSPHQG